jgi:hypothetical protein
MHYRAGDSTFIEFNVLTSTPEQSQKSLIFFKRRSKCERRHDEILCFNIGALHAVNKTDILNSCKKFATTHS